MSTPVPIEDNVEISTLLKMIVHRNRVAQTMLHLAHELEVRAHAHDLSKFFPDEFAGFCELNANRGGKIEKYGSESYEAGIKTDAVSLHLARNDHHLDHNSLGLSGMSICRVIEMLVDWEVARQERDTTEQMREAWEARQKRFKLTDYEAKFLEDIWDAIKIDLDQW